MRCNRLTSTSAPKRDIDGHIRLVSRYTWRGTPIEVCDSARNVLAIIELFADEEQPAERKQEKLLRWLFFDTQAAIEAAGNDLQELVSDVMWDVCGLDVTPDHIHTTEDGSPAFDWDEDAARIRASLLSAYGIDWDAKASSMTYSAVSDLLGALLEADSQTPFQQAVIYRKSDPPKRTKHNGDLVDAWNARREHFALKGISDDEIAYQNAAAAADFEAAFREAGGE